MANDWKDRLGMVFSTNPNYDYKTEETEELETLSKSKQRLRVNIERKGRKGKCVTIVTGFVGTSEDLKSLEKVLKTKCGTGGSSKEGEIIIQGELKEKIVSLLTSEGYTFTK
ncbi:MAG: translation initiation factor [Bacteroidaceae bacterium]